MFLTANPPLKGGAKLIENIKTKETSKSIPPFKGWSQTNYLPFKRWSQTYYFTYSLRIGRTKQYYFGSTFQKGQDTAPYFVSITATKNLNKSFVSPCVPVPHSLSYCFVSYCVSPIRCLSLICPYCPYCLH